MEITNNFNNKNRIFPLDNDIKFIQHATSHSTLTSHFNNNYNNNHHETVTKATVKATTTTAITNYNNLVTNSLVVQRGSALNFPNKGNNPLLEKFKKTKSHRFCSLRIIIILLIILLVISCAFFVWLTSFITSSRALDSLYKIVVKNMDEKVHNYFNGNIKPFINLVHTVAQDWNEGVVNEEIVKKYLLTKYRNYLPTSIGYFFGELRTQAYIIHTQPSPTGIPEETQYFFINQSVNQVTQLFSLNTTSGTTQFSHYDFLYNITNEAFYNYGKLKCKEDNNIEGVFGAPYIVRNDGGIALYYIVKIYNQTLYSKGIKEFVGFTKLNLSLTMIQNFLSKLTTIGSGGYVLVAEENNFVIGGSINTTSTIKRLNLFEITDRNAGVLMKDIFNIYNGFNNPPLEITINSLGVKYIVSVLKYELENIKWNIFIVMLESDILEGININIGASAGVAAALLIIGLIISVLVGFVITRPLKYLESQFENIKQFNLNDVKMNRSIFSELNNIYTNLEEMVDWLKEFKSFLPENVFIQLMEMNEEISDNKLTSSYESVNTYNGSFITSDASSFRNKSGLFTSFKIKEGNAAYGTSSIFRLGLSQKDCSIVYVRFPTLTSGRSAEEIAIIFSKLVSSISSVTKGLRADVQIISVEEFQLLFAGYQSLSFRALNAAIKIAKTIEECQQHFAIDIPFHIGISSGKSHVGNLGTNEFRCYAVVGEVKDVARKLSYLAQVLNLKIVFDESSLIENFFIARPVDKIKIEEEIKIVYELIKESTIDADEWMYELERRKEIQKYLEFESVFNVLKEEIKEEEKEQFILDLNDALEKIANHVTLMPSDTVICNRIMSVITEILDCDTIEEMNSILNEYYSVVSIDVKLSKQRENIKF